MPCVHCFYILALGDGPLKKNEYALAHFARVNEQLEKNGSARRYRFNFLTQKSFNLFFQALRQGNVASFRSEMDVS